MREDRSQREQELDGRLLQFELALTRDNKTQVTIKSYLKRLQLTARNTDIDDSEAVKAYIASKSGQNTKAGYVCAYDAFMNWQSKTWRAPKYRTYIPIPEFIPTEEELYQL